MAGYIFQIELYSDPGFEYQTFPREALDRHLALTVMLWQNLEGLEDGAIAPNLMDRNSVLEGGVRVARIKVFRAQDIDSRGESMLGARLVQLDGNETFLRGLSKLPRSHRISLGVGTVIIRGGDRAPEPLGSTWGQGKTMKKPTSYSEAAAMNSGAADLNISAASIHSYAAKSTEVMREAERSIRGANANRNNGRRF